VVGRRPPWRSRAPRVEAGGQGRSAAELNRAAVVRERLAHWRSCGKPNEPEGRVEPGVQRIGSMRGDELPPASLRNGAWAAAGSGLRVREGRTNPKTAEILGAWNGAVRAGCPAPLAPDVARGARYGRPGSGRTSGAPGPEARPARPVLPAAHGRAARPSSVAARVVSAGADQRKSWMRVTRRPPRPCFSIACSQVVNSSLERL
jgi:hypothetical protein